MTLREFLNCMAKLERGTGRVLEKERAEIWFDVLGDLPVDALNAAVARFLLEDESGWLPAPGKLRRYAVEARDGRSRDAGEAWAILQTTIKRISPHFEPQRFLNALPADVRPAATMIGCQRLADGDDNPAALHAQFRECFRQAQEREQQARLLPPGLVPRIRDGRLNTDAEPEAIGETLARLPSGAGAGRGDDRQPKRGGGPHNETGTRKPQPAVNK